VIYVTLHRSQSLLSKTIRLFTRDKYSHSSIVINDEKFDSAGFIGVRKNFQWERGEEIDFFILATEITKEQEENLKVFLDNQIGKQYDYKMLMGFITKSSREERKSSGKWFCSELVFASLEKIGIKLFNNIEPWKVYPSMLYYSHLLAFSHTLKT